MASGLWGACEAGEGGPASSNGRAQLDVTPSDEVGSASATQASAAGDSDADAGAQRAELDGWTVGDLMNLSACNNFVAPVLSNDPETSSGSVSRWLESTNELVMEGTNTTLGHHLLPDAAEQSVYIWWSIAGPDTGYLYAQQDRTRVAHAVDFDRISDIENAAALDFHDRVVGPLEIGAIVVFHDLDEDRYVGMQIDDIYNTDPGHEYDWLCTALDASWKFAASGSDDFSAD